MIEDHAEFKDACQELETRIDEISDDLRNLPTDYKMIGQYSDIDQEINMNITFFNNDIITKINTFVADKNRRASN